MFYFDSAVLWDELKYLVLAKIKLRKTLRLLITHKYRGSQQFSRVEYSTQIYKFVTRGAKEYLQVLAAELSIQPHLEINYMQQSDQSQSSMIVLIIVATTMVTVTVIAVVL